MVYEEIAANMLEFAKNIIAYGHMLMIAYPISIMSLLQLIEICNQLQIEVKDYPYLKTYVLLHFQVHKISRQQISQGQ